MDYSKQNVSNYYLYDTQVENLFLSEYMASAPGEYVKAYLLALMYAQLNKPADDRMIARSVGMAPEKMAECWAYWESRGVVRRIYADPEDSASFRVEFVNLREEVFGSRTPAAPEAKASARLDDKALAKLYRDVEAVTGRMMEAREPEEIASWLSEYGMSPEFILCGYRFCTAKRRSNRCRYVATVLKDWKSKGFSSPAQVEEYLEGMDRHFDLQKQIFKALGFSRNATEEEKRIMNKWFDDYGFDLEKIKDACSKTSGISSPNFNYVNKVLLGWRKESESRGTDVNRQVNVTNAQLKQYYEYLRLKGDEEASQRRSEVYASIPRIREIDERYRELGAMMSKALISGRAEEGQEIREQMESLSMERAVLLTDNEYEMDYTDHRYLCEKCHDTGVTDLGERCTCVPLRLEEAEVWLKQQGE